MKKMTQGLALLAAAPLVLAGLAGCSSSGGSGDGPVTITFQEQFTDAETAEFTELLKQFEEANPDIDVKLIRDNDSSYYDKLTTQITGGKGPDLVRVEPPRASQFIASGWALPLGDAAGSPDDYFPASLDAITKDGELYGVPVDVSALALFYRTDLFEAAGITEPPATWEEFTADAEKLTSGDAHGVGLFGGWGGFEFYPWLWQSGAQVLNDDQTEAVFNSPDAVRALQLWVDLQKSAMPAGMATATEDDLKGPFIAGDLGMMTSGPWMIPALQDANIDGKWAIAPLPADKEAATVLGGLDLLVLKNSEHPEQAKTFVSWLMQDEVQKEWASALGYLPVKASLYEDPTFKDDPSISAFSAVLDQARSRPTVPQAGDIDTALGEAVQAALSGSKSPQEALDAAVEASNKALQ
ncbi:ABC transporter substrate-binding protein [Herbiconiux ginsengi]|uniref:Carbohydrate ABC transporter substrate-binding protein, CUT1 family n=1 Tax=Herbiconiux ginsengi TaxID=381665 RepID=A0A1H3T6E6_9MICO|nr:ABC transporter substrate-binding protein [Herbiconiux ginsengi]SDZ45497.1 carbohydrate ABC transporter substrate-binding protein, CUT1 family [Herbiconiux ginsengi]